MKWGLVCKPGAKSTISLAKDVYDFLKENGDVFAEKNFAEETKIKGHSLEEINKKSDIVVILGGDGTILWTLQGVDKPVFAINSGGMGFLSEVESKYAIGGLKQVIEGKYNIEERAKLKITVDGKRL